MMRALVDGVLAIWGERLFYPKVRKTAQPAGDLRLPESGAAAGEQLRAKLRALVRGAPEVMVRVTGRGRGMRAIQAHLRYIGRRGALEIEDERGEKILGAEALRDLGEEWRLAGAEIPSRSGRREAFYLMLSMPPEIDPAAVLAAARDMARAEFARNKFALVLHDPSTDPRSTRPHVHLMVRAQGWDRQRLRPQKADLARWRQAFADRLQERGVLACATPRQARGELQAATTRGYQHGHRLVREAGRQAPSERLAANQIGVLQAWRELVRALSRSEDAQDRALAGETLDFVRRMPLLARREALLRQREPTGLRPSVEQREPEHDGTQSLGLARHRDRSPTR